MSGAFDLRMDYRLQEADGVIALKDATRKREERLPSGTALVSDCWYSSICWLRSGRCRWQQPARKWCAGICAD